MIRYQLDFQISEGNINTFFIGSKKLFEQFEYFVKLLAKSIDIDIKVKHKLIELESNQISYELELDIEHPVQRVLGNDLDSEQINGWITKGIELLFKKNSTENFLFDIDKLATELSLNNYILYKKLSVNIIEKYLDDLENLSILLFNRLVFIRK